MSVKARSGTFGIGSRILAATPEDLVRVFGGQRMIGMTDICTLYSARRAHNEWRQACGVNVRIQTARYRLHDRGLNARRPHVVPDLTARHRRLRLQWAEEHRGWTLNQWGTVLFTDESRFTVDHNDGHVRVWRRQGARYDPQFAVQHNRWGAGSVMVWG